MGLRVLREGWRGRGIGWWGNEGIFSSLLVVEEAVLLGFGLDCVGPEALICLW